MSVDVSVVIAGEPREGLIGRVFPGQTAQVTITAPPLPELPDFPYPKDDDELQAAYVTAWRRLKDTVGKPRGLSCRYGRDGVVIITASVRRPAITDAEEFERIVAAAWPVYAH